MGAPAFTDEASGPFPLPPVGADQHGGGDDAVLDEPAPVQRLRQGRIGEEQPGGEGAPGRDEAPRPLGPGGASSW